MNLTNAQGSLDDGKVEVDLDRAVVLAGAAWAAGSTVGIAAEVYAAPADAVTGRVAVRAALGRGGAR